MSSTKSTLWAAEERLRALDWGALGSVRPDVLEVLSPVLGGVEAARALAHLLRRHPTWTAAERTVSAEAVFGVALWRRRLRHHARQDTPAGLLEALVSFGASEAAGPAPTDWATRLSYPDWLGEVLAAALGMEAEPFAAASNLPGPVTIRANTLRTRRESLAEWLALEGVEARPTTYAPDGLTLSGRPNILGLLSHQSGHFEVQDEGSQLVAHCLGVEPGEDVLDLCAGAGGKTLLLGARLVDRGKLYAYDVDHASLARLEHRAARAGLGKFLHVLRAMPPDLRVNCALVDAPCSALGTLRRGPDVRWRLDPASLAEFPRVQGEVLETAAMHTAPGGRLVYATCTVRPEENQGVVEAFLATHADFSRARLQLPEELLSPHGELVTTPHRHGMDGFYAAMLIRSGG